MALARGRRTHGGGLEAWPGYVDALSTLLMVIIFVLLVFALAQPRKTPTGKRGRCGCRPASLPAHHPEDRRKDGSGTGSEVGDNQPRPRLPEERLHLSPHFN